MMKRKSDNWYNPLKPELLEELGRKTFWENPSSDFEQIERFLKPSDEILEVWAGTWRLWIQLIKKGYNYTWVDRQKRFLDLFKKKLEEIEYDPKKVRLILADFEELPENEKYDVIIFSWTVIWDFSKEEQVRILEKAKRLLKDGWIVLLDNPAEGQKYNTVDGYEPTPFYYEDWRKRLEELWFKW